MKWQTASDITHSLYQPNNTGAIQTSVQTSVTGSKNTCQAKSARKQAISQHILRKGPHAKQEIETHCLIRRARQKLLFELLQSVLQHCAARFILHQLFQDVATPLHGERPSRVATSVGKRSSCVLGRCHWASVDDVLEALQNDGVSQRHSLGKVRPPGKDSTNL